MNKELAEELFLAWHFFDPAGFEEDLHGGETGGAAERMSAECGDMSEHGVAGEGPHMVPAGNERAHRQAAAERLSKQEDVGKDIIGLEAPECSGAAKARLDLIEDEECTGFVTALPQLSQPGSIGGMDAPFGLNGLGDDAGGAIGDGVEGLGRVVFYVTDTGQQGTKGIAPVFITHDAEGALGRAVIRLVEGDDVRAAGDAFGQFHGAFDGFGAAVGEVDGVEGGGQMVGEEGGVLDLGCLDQFAIDKEVEVAVGLFLYRFDNAGMAVTGVTDADTADQVEVFLAGAVVKVASFCLYDVQAQWVRGSLRDVAME